MHFTMLNNETQGPVPVESLSAPRSTTRKKVSYNHGAMKTLHQVHFSSSASMKEIKDESVELVVTSPPYPMIQMWDEDFGRQDPDVTAALRNGDGRAAFELMHCLLDAVWRECARVVRPGGFVCVNIGDATRKVGDNFRLYTNHSRITLTLEAAGLQSLPLVLWRKQTTAPNKFMGSGMLPSGAYVTLEHEYILVFRKGDKRVFAGPEVEARRASAFFWEERNTWFSDVWDFKGIRQGMDKNDARSRSAAYPFELAFRLISMYSLRGDTVLDPFLGTGTTSAACVAAARNSVGYEITSELEAAISETMGKAGLAANQLTLDRFRNHAQFVEERQGARGTPLGHVSDVYGFPVMTRQEVQLQLLKLDDLTQEGPARYTAEHSPAQPDSLTTPVVQTGAVSGEDEDQLAFSFTK